MDPVSYIKARTYGKAKKGKKTNPTLQPKIANV